MSIKDLPHVTVEQVLALRKSAIEIEKELTELKASLPKVRADAVKEGIKAARDIMDDEDADTSWGYDGDCGVFNRINYRLDKLEAGNE